MLSLAGLITAGDAADEEQAANDAQSASPQASTWAGVGDGAPLVMHWCWVWAMTWQMQPEMDTGMEVAQIRKKRMLHWGDAVSGGGEGGDEDKPGVLSSHPPRHGQT